MASSWARGRAGSSTIPARWATGFPGHQIQPPDHAVVPPMTGAFSSKTPALPKCGSRDRSAKPARARANDGKIELL